MRKRLKSAIALLAIFAAVAGGVCSAGVATASAANCNVSEDSTWWDGYVLNFNGIIGGCSSDVSAVEFGGTGGGAGWYDGSLITGNPWEYATYAWPAAVRPSSGENIWVSSVSRNYHVASWCGGANHVVQTFFDFRIQSAWNGWGPWHTRWSAVYHILC